MRDDSFDIAYRLLDSELVDSDGRRCGRVDDIEIEGEPGEPAEITATLSGPGVWAQRLPRPLWRLAGRVFGDDYTRVPWDAVRDIAEVTYLKGRGHDLGLGRGDDSVGRIVKRMPGS
jgi:sporulation protein YlmC with PRC-barrel domain